jgi:hypothetical protein
MLAQGRIQRVTTLIYPAVTRRALRTSIKASRYNGRPRHSLLKIRYAAHECIRKRTSRASHQPAAFCYPYRFLLVSVIAFR